MDRVLVSSSLSILLQHKRTNQLSEKLQKLQNRAARVITTQVMIRTLAIFSTRLAGTTYQLEGRSKR